MQSDILDAVEANHIVDISTTGRKTGRVHRHEIWLHTADSQFYLTGKPAPRDWHANVLAHPQMIVHLKHDLVKDVSAYAIPITDPTERRTLLTKLLQDTPYIENLEAWVAGSPLVRITMQTTE